MHSAEMIGLAGWVLVDTLLRELEKSDPGIRKRVFQKAIADNQAAARMDPGGNAAAIVAVLQSVAV
jgi:hypothetical protein